MIGLIVAVTGCAKKLAQVNGVTLTMDQFYERLMKENGQNMVVALIMEQLILEEAQQQGLLPTDQEVKKWLADFKQSQDLQTDEKWAQFLRGQGLEEEDFLKKGQVELAFFKLRTAHLRPTEAQLQAFFRQHREGFNTPAAIRFRQIVVDTPEKVDKVREKLAQGFDFGALAKQYSIDPQAQHTGGDVGLQGVEALPIPQDRGGVGMPEPLYQVIKDLPVEKVAGPVPLTFEDPTGQGKAVKRFFFFLVTERRAKKVVTYKEVRDRVRQAYLESQAKPQEEVLHQLAQKADVIIYEDRYRALESQFGGKVPQPNIPVPASVETPGRESAGGQQAAPASKTPPKAPPAGKATGAGSAVPTLPVGKASDGG